MISKTEKMRNMTVKSFQTYYDNGNTNNIHASIDTLMRLGSRVVFIAVDDNAAVALLIATINGHVNNGTVWLILGDSVIISEQVDEYLRVYNGIIHTRLYNAKQHITTYKAPIEQLAWNTNSVKFLTIERLFVGGIFILEQQTKLVGYSLYDMFQ
jgi:hypothetical protein